MRTTVRAVFFVGAWLILMQICISWFLGMDSLGQLWGLT